MTTIFIYFLKVNLLLSFTFAFYYVFLRRETFVRTIRWYFLLAIAGSFILPSVFWTREIILEDTPILLDQWLVDSKQVDLPTDHTMQVIETTVNWQDYAISLYAGIGALFLLSLLVQYLRVLYRIGSLHSCEIAGNVLVDHRTKDAYSFWNSIVLPANYKQIERIDLVLLHESIHIKQKHSVDLLIIGVTKAVCWINPFVYLLQRAINLNLEFLVDQQVSRDINTFDYQKALLEYQYARLEHTSIVNSFKSSDFKRRIIMLNTQKSPIMKKMKLLLLMPFLLAFFGFFQVQVKAKINNSKPDSESLSNFVDQLQSQSLPVILSDFDQKQLAPILAQDTLGLVSEISKDQSDKSTDSTVQVYRVERGKKQTKKSEQLKGRGLDKLAEIGKHSPMYIVDGENADSQQVKAILPEDIESVYVFEPKQGIEKYGEEGKNGVVFILTIDNNDQEKNLRKIELRKELQKRKVELKKERQARKLEVAVSKEMRDDAVKERIEKRKAEIAARQELHQKSKTQVQDQKNKTSRIRDTKKLNETTVHVVDGKFYTFDEVVAFLETTNGTKNMKIYNAEDAKKVFNYTGNKKVFEYTLKTDEDVENEKQVRQITREYKEKMRKNKLRESSFVGLYVLDGTPVSYEQMMQVKPIDIKSVSILKKQEAVEKYGVEGENGAMEIKVK